jgi:predicted nucleic acid-binding protein
LDTNCVSELVRVKPEPRVLAWMEAADESLLHLSVLTLGEVRKGLAALPQGRRRTRLEAWLEVDLRARFSGRILPVDAAVAHRWGLLAATALRHNLTLVSRNVSDFAAAQVPVLNPWEPS